jgi:hypothetical protein
MATEENKAPKKRKAQGPRQVKPLHLLVRINDEQGNPIQFDKSQVSVEVVKDPQVLIDLLTGGGMEGATYVRFTPPADKAPAAA